MHSDWKPVIFLAVVGVLVIGAQFGAYTIKNANAQEVNPPTFETLVQLHVSDETIKPDDTPSLKTPRQKVCVKLIKNIEQAYFWDINRGDIYTRPYLAATIQIYKSVNGKILCNKSVFEILEDAKNGK